jgi:hypothetical protein
VYLNVGRYAMTINVIGFAYSGLQGLDLLHQLTTGKNLVGTRVRYSFDFAIDQVILCYPVLNKISSSQCGMLPPREGLEIGYMQLYPG